MLTNLDPSSEIFLADLNRIQRRMADANRRISSGRRIAVASDAPDEIDSLLQLRADLERNTQIRTNLGRAQTEVDTAEMTLQSATKLMDRALALANQGANFTQDAAGRASIAQEVGSIQEQLISYTRTTVEGRFIFGGDQDQAPPYESDPAADNGVARLTSETATRRVEDPAGGSFLVAKTAQDIFDVRNSDDTFATGNIFAAVKGLQNALANNVPADIDASIVALRQASDYLNRNLAFYGTVQGRLQDANDFAASYEVQLRSELSQKEDADVTAAALEATQGNTQLQAAMTMRARMPHSSLFDFLG